MGVKDGLKEAHESLNRKFFRRRFEKKINRFPNILQRLLARLALRPAAIERRAMRDEVTIFTVFNDDFEIHVLLIICLQAKPPAAKKPALQQFSPDAVRRWRHRPPRGAWGQSWVQIGAYLRKSHG